MRNLVEVIVGATALSVVTVLALSCQVMVKGSKGKYRPVYTGLLFKKLRG